MRIRCLTLEETEIERIDSDDDLYHFTRGNPFRLDVCTHRTCIGFWHERSTKYAHRHTHKVMETKNLLFDNFIWERWTDVHNLDSFEQIFRGLRVFRQRWRRQCRRNTGTSMANNVKILTNGQTSSPIIPEKRARRNGIHSGDVFSSASNENNCRTKQDKKPSYRWWWTLRVDDL